MRLSYRKLPVSPHISIYSFPITVLASIFHRLSGLLLIILAFVYTWDVIIHYYDINFQFAISTLTFLLTGSIGRLTYSLFSVSLFFHFLNGLRYFLWDIFHSFNLKFLKISSVFIFCSTVVFAVFLSVILFF